MKRRIAAVAVALAVGLGYYAGGTINRPPPPTTTTTTTTPGASTLPAQA